jgi:hypothetical protein
VRVSLDIVLLVLLTMGNVGFHACVVLRAHWSAKRRCRSRSRRPDGTQNPAQVAIHDSYLPSPPCSALQTAENFSPDFCKFSSPIRTSTYAAHVQQNRHFGPRSVLASACKPMPCMLRKN